MEDVGDGRTGEARRSMRRAKTAGQSSISARQAMYASHIWRMNGQGKDAGSGARELTSVATRRSLRPATADHVLFARRLSFVEAHARKAYSG